ncbi:MAG: hypothetical protein H7Y38_07905 [Armatimonadetes bacterium]|nr:hypothetical protein [Armatimonadota bacterium]
MATGSTDSTVMVDPITNGEADAPNGMGMATSDNAPLMPTGTHGGGMGSGAGMDTDDLQDGTDGVPETNKSAPTDGAGTGNYANGPDLSETDDEQTGVVGEVNGDDKAAGGI